MDFPAVYDVALGSQSDGAACFYLDGIWITHNQTDGRTGNMSESTRLAAVHKIVQTNNTSKRADETETN